MKTQPITPAPHLTQADLDRVASPEEAASLSLRCHQEDWFVHSSELDAYPREITSITTAQSANRQS